MKYNRGLMGFIMEDSTFRPCEINKFGSNPTVFTVKYAPTITDDEPKKDVVSLVMKFGTETNGQLCEKIERMHCGDLELFSTYGTSGEKTYFYDVENDTTDGIFYISHKLPNKDGDEITIYNNFSSIVFSPDRNNKLLFVDESKGIGEVLYRYRDVVEENVHDTRLAWYKSISESNKIYAVFLKDWECNAGFALISEEEYETLDRADDICSLRSSVSDDKIIIRNRGGDIILYITKDFYSKIMNHHQK